VLASRAGVTLQRLDPKMQSEYSRLYLLLEKATRFLEDELEQSTEAKEYLKHRGLSDETRKVWRIGFAPNDWRALFNHLLKEGFKPEEMEKVGLVKRARAEDGSPKQGDKFYDTFRGRIMFPIQDSASRVIAFSGRILPALDDGKTGKYINSPETILFKKSEVLHGFHLAKLAIRERDAVILVEGQMDLLMAHQAGYTHTVAVSGTALTLEQLARLKRLSENVLLSFDADSAGIRASERALSLALSQGMNVKVIALTGGKDPAELILKDPKEWEKAVKEAKHVVDFLLEHLLRKVTEGRERAIAVEKTLLPLLLLLPSRVEQSHFIKAIADKLGLREQSLWEAFDKLPSPARPAPGNVSEKKSPAPSRPDARERQLFAILFFAESREEKDTRERIRETLTRIMGKERFEEALARYEPLRDMLLLEASVRYGDESVSEKEEQELLHHFEEDELRRQLSEMMHFLTEAERGGDKEKTAALLQKYSEVSQKLGALTSARFLDSA